MRCWMIIRSVVLVFLVGWMSLAVGEAAAQGFPTDNATKAERLFVRGMTKAYLDHHEAALGFFQKALDLTPNEPAILSAMAVSEEVMENVTMALFYAEQALFYAPENAYYHHQLAQLHLRADDLKAAAQTYEALLERFPNDFEALEDLAELQATMGRHGDAIATYLRLIDRAGDHPRLRRQILQLYFSLGDKEGTRRSLEALIELEPTDPAPYRLLGQLYLQQQKQHDALQAFEQAYDVDENDLETVLALADLYRQMGREDDADRLFTEAMDVEGATVEALLARATPLYQRADADDEAAQTATRLLEQAVEQAPDHADALFMLGDLRYQTGAYAEAARLLESTGPAVVAACRCGLPRNRPGGGCRPDRRRGVAAVSRTASPASGGGPQFDASQPERRGHRPIRGGARTLRRGKFRTGGGPLRSPGDAGIALRPQAGL